MGGRVLTLDVKEGDRVEAGARCCLDPPTALAIARARTEQAAAEAQRLARGGPSQDVSAEAQ
jgi:hypothetical protein